MGEEEDKGNSIIDWKELNNSKLSKVDFLSWIVKKCQQLSNTKLEFESKAIEEFSELIVSYLIKVYESEETEIEALVTMTYYGLMEYANRSEDQQKRQREQRDVAIILQFVKESIVRIVEWKDKKVQSKRNIFVRQAFSKKNVISPPVMVAKLPAELIDDLENGERPFWSRRKRTSTDFQSPPAGGGFGTLPWRQRQVGSQTTPSLMNAAEKPKEPSRINAAIVVGGGADKRAQQQQREEEIARMQRQEESDEVIDVTPTKKIKRETVDDEVEEVFNNRSEGAKSSKKLTENGGRSCEGNVETERNGKGKGPKEEIDDDGDDEDIYVKQSGRVSLFAVAPKCSVPAQPAVPVAPQAEEEEEQREEVRDNEEEEEEDGSSMDSNSTCRMQSPQQQQEELMKEVKAEPPEEEKEEDNGGDDEEEENGGGEGPNMEDDYEEETTEGEEENGGTDFGDDEDDEPDNMQPSNNLSPPQLPDDIEGGNANKQRIAGTNGGGQLSPTKALRPYAPIEPPAATNAHSAQIVNGNLIKLGSLLKRLPQSDEIEDACPSSSVGRNHKLIKLESPQKLSEFDELLVEQRPSTSSNATNGERRKYSGKVKIRKRADYMAEQKVKRQLCNGEKVVRFSDKVQTKYFHVAKEKMTRSAADERNPYFTPPSTTKFLKTTAPKAKKNGGTKQNHRLLTLQTRRDVQDLVEAVKERCAAVEAQKDKLVRLTRVLLTDSLLAQLNENVFKNIAVLRTLEHPKDMSMFVENGLTDNIQYLINPANLSSFEFSYIFVVFGHDQIVLGNTFPTPADFLGLFRSWFRTNLPYIRDNQLRKTYEEEEDNTYHYTPPLVVAVTLPEVGKHAQQIAGFNVQMREFVESDRTEYNDYDDHLLLLDWAKLVAESPNAKESMEERVKLLAWKMQYDFGVLIK